MPSFDVVSQVNQHELRNAVDQANREISNRFDFKGSDARVEQQDGKLVIHADDEFKVGQVRDVLQLKLTKRNIDLGCLEFAKVESLGGMKARQEVTVRQGISSELGKKIGKLVKESKLKLQSVIQGEEVRISGKNRDDLQAAIALLRKQDLGQPLQFINFRD